MRRFLTAAALLAFLTACGSSPTPAPTSVGPITVSPAAVWPAPRDASAAARSAGLDMLGEEGQVLHIHVHLDVFVNGTPVSVPPEIGIDVAAQRISPLHTHDDTGVIHVESPVVRDFTLGQFFAEWQQPLTANPAGPTSVYLDGKPYSGYPAALVLRAHQEIAVVYGTAPARIPLDYSFAEGL
jgi:hypothetical protein